MRELDEGRESDHTSGHDDESARRLLGPLDEESPPPSRLDVAGLVRGGRRRVRYRRLVGLGGAATVTAFALVAAPLVVEIATGRTADVTPSLAEVSASPTAEVAPPMPTSCTVTQLPVPRGAYGGQVMDGDPTGRYLVGTARSLDDARVWVLLWDRGQVQVIKTPAATPPGEEPGNLVVNSRGEVAGDVMAVKPGVVSPAAWVYRNGVISELPGLADRQMTVRDINERGDVLGMEGFDPLLSPKPAMGVRAGGLAVRKGDSPRPVVWPADAPGTLRTLGLPDQPGTVGVTGIDDDGTVVGRWQDANASEVAADPRGRYFPLDRIQARPVVWDRDGSPRFVPVPRSYGPGGLLLSVRDGWAVGWVEVQGKPGPDRVSPMRWNLSTGQTLAPADLVSVSGVNRYGWMAGAVTVKDGAMTPAVGFGDRTLTLPLPGDSRTTDYYGTEARTISDDGRVIGGTVQVAKWVVAARWTCT